MRALTLSALLLSGCASFTDTAKRHPYVTGFVVTSLALSGRNALRNHHDHEPVMSEPLTAPGIDGPNCSQVNCK